MPSFGNPDIAARSYRPTPAAAPRRHVRELYNPDQMVAVLRRERGRSDRQKCSFSIVLFRMEPAPRSRNTMMRLATILLRCIRETDELGCYDDHTLCAVLPDTGPAGAAMLIDRVRRATATKPYHPVCTVYTYPDAPDGGDGNSSDRSRSDGDGSIGLTMSIHPDNAPATEVARTLPDDLANLPVHSMSELLAEPLPLWKRLLDVCIASVAILASAPLMIGAAIAIRFSSPGPIIFRQKRTGLGGQSFTIYKFRTMGLGAEKRQAKLKAVSEQDGPAFKLKNDPRVFPAGRMLRKTSIDELPQLFNVLLGDMTLVGPRPLPVHEADACSQWQQRRHDITPGLTCIWQVEGRSRVKFDDWMRMDMRYARRRSLTKDVALVLKTIPAVLLRRGAN